MTQERVLNELLLTSLLSVVYTASNQNAPVINNDPRRGFDSDGRVEFVASRAAAAV